MADHDSDEGRAAASSAASSADGLRGTVEDRRVRYEDAEEGLSWLETNLRRVRQLLGDGPIQDYVFGPFAALLHPQSDGNDDTIRAVITQVAVVNALLAGLPGQLGIGIVVCQAFEGWMAWRIAGRVGLQVERPRDLLKHFGLVGGVLATLVVGMRALLHLLYPIFAAFPFPMVPVELLATDLVGVLFWVGFREAREHGSFRVPKRLFGSVLQETAGLFKYQWGKLRALLNRETLKSFGKRLKQWFNGELVAPTPPVTDDALVALAMSSLVAGQQESLHGPLGLLFLQSVRDLYADLAHASQEQIARAMSAYDEDQMVGVLANIKGRLFERLMESKLDHGITTAKLWPDRCHPSTDLVLENSQTHEWYALSLKATDNPQLIEHALQRYPHDQVLTTSEVARHFAGSPMVHDSGVSNHELAQVTAENYQQMLHSLPPSGLQVAGHLVAAGAVSTALQLWPFVAAWLRGRITKEQLQAAMVRVYGEGGKRLVVKLAVLSALGPTYAPLYAWYLLARFATTMAQASGITE